MTRGAGPGSSKTPARGAAEGGTRAPMNRPNPLGRRSEAAFQFIQGIYAPIMDYKIYVDILLTLFFGWQIVKAFADVVAWPVAKKQGEAAGKAVSNLMKLLGIGALVARSRELSPADPRRLPSAAS